MMQPLLRILLLRMRRREASDFITTQEIITWVHIDNLEWQPNKSNDEMTGASTVMV
jgi:hypothetical protein